MKFKEVIGQEKIKQYLVNLVRENRLSHALLLLGPEGCGNLPLAIAFAQYINCENRTSEDSCGICKSCNKFNKLIHPDLHFVFPVASTSSVGTNPVSNDFLKSWRELVLANPYFSPNQWYEYIGLENKQGIISKNESYDIIKKLNLKTFEAEFKIMIIWLPEKMNAASANKLLKILEEPPEKTLFLFVSENSGPILPTILSRLQLIKIPKIDKNSMSQALEEKFGLPAREAANIAQIADGNYVKAIQISQNQGETQYNLGKFTLLMRYCFNNNVIDVLNLVDEIATIGREKQKSFLAYSLRLMRENLILNQGLDKIAHLDEPELNFSKNFSPFVNLQNVFKIYEELNNAYYHIEANGYNKLVFFDLSLKLMKLIKR